MLEGKAKEMFEKWYCENFVLHEIDAWSIAIFYEKPKSMQWGVIQDWADSVGMKIEILTEQLGCGNHWYYIVNDSDSMVVTYSLPEAREAAITKLSELVNNKYK